MPRVKKSVRHYRSLRESLAEPSGWIHHAACGKAGFRRNDATSVFDVTCESYKATEEFKRVSKGCEV